MLFPCIILKNLHIVSGASYRHFWFSGFFLFSFLIRDFFCQIGNFGCCEFLLVQLFFDLMSKFHLFVLIEFLLVLCYYGIYSVRIHDGPRLNVFGYLRG